jgi:hypothetical protein
VDARHKAGHDELRENAQFHWLHFESDRHVNPDRFLVRKTAFLLQDSKSSYIRDKGSAWGDAARNAFS